MYRTINDYTSKIYEYVKGDCMEENYYVYKHTNMENGLVYYGITTDYLSRWNNGFGYQNNNYFWNDIVRYGWKNFKHEIIFENINREKARFYEGMLIQETQSYLPENGYNQNIGERMEYREIIIDEDETVNENKLQFAKRPRNGRGGVPVYCDGKVYLTIKELADEIGEEPLVISQMLNPNSPRKISSYFAEKGLRYATDEEICDFYKINDNV